MSGDRDCDRDDHDDHHAFEAGQPTPQQDLAIARRALTEGDTRHAAHHVACALAVDPTSAEVLALADELIATTVDPMVLTDTDGEMYFGTVALRAHTLFRLGDLGGAITLLLAVIGTRPDVPFVTWLEDWLDDGAAARLDPTDVHTAIEDALGRLESTEHPTAPLPDLLDLVTQVRRHHPDHERLAGTHARTLRRAGRHDEAVAVARALHATSPTYFASVILASSLRDAGDLEGALAVFRELASRHPGQDAVLLDIGDILLELDRPGEAAAAYQPILDADPHHEWAEPSTLYARYLESGEGAWRDRLEDIAEEHDEGRARQLAEAVTPYLGYLPERRETLVKLASQLAGDTTTVGALTVCLRSLEAPSAMRVLAELTRDRGGAFLLEAEVPAPDPRMPWRPVAFSLWKYDGLRAVPCRPPPPAAILDAIAPIAEQPFHAAMWAEQASDVGRELGVAAVEGLLAAMVHGSPTPLPEGWPASDWAFRHQIAAAMTLAFVDEGWTESARRTALLSAVYGPVDWTSAAALIALARLACIEPELVADIETILDQAHDVAMTPIHRLCLVEPAVHLALQLPGMSLATKRTRRARRAELEVQG